MATSENDRFIWVTWNAIAPLLLLYPIYKIVYNLYFHPLTNIPGPRHWGASRLPYIWSLLRGTIVHDFEKLHRFYGPIIRVAPNEVTFAMPEAYDDILQPRSGHKQFLKDPVWWRQQQPGLELPDSLLSSIDPEAHARMRRLFLPAFTTGALRAQEPMIQKYVTLLIERLRERIKEAKDLNEEGAKVDMVPWFHFTTFDIFGDLGFGESFDCLEHSRYHPWISLLFNSVKAASYVGATRFYPVLGFLLAMAIPPSLEKMAKNHYQQIADKVQRRLNWEIERPDIMSHFLREGGEKGMEIGEINSNFGFLTTAGSETTATTLVGTLNYLIHNKDKLNILIKEIRETFHKPDEVTIDAVRNLPYLNAVLKEGLRLCPPIPWVLPRLVPEGGDVVCGAWLHGGTSVSIQAYTMNRDPTLFRSATTFIPERWLHSASDPASPYFNDQRDALQPFTVGPRACMGKHLAWAELRLILTNLLLAFDFEPGSPKLTWEDLRTFLLVEKKPLQVVIKEA